MGVVSKMDAHQKLGDGDGRDGYVVIIGDEVHECRTRSVGVHEEGGVEEKSAQGRLSISSSCRTEVTSPAKAVSGR